VRSSELREIEERRDAERAESLRTSPSAIRRAMQVRPMREPGEGWDDERLRAEVEEAFRELGARVWREEKQR
jgi:hypothetical protein